MFRELMKKPYSLLIIFALFTAIACGGRMYLAESRPPERGIVVDGDADDWLGALSFLEEEKLSVGFMNDQNNLYICLILERDQAPGLLMRQGLTVWFDPAGGKKKTLGIKYPLGGAPTGRSMPRMMDRPEGTQRNILRDFPDELEILKSDMEFPEKKTLDQAKKEGLKVQVNSSEGSFVYELKIPLLASESQPLAIGVAPGATIGVGFEADKLDMSQIMRRPQGGMGAPVGGGIAGMGRGRGGPGMRPGMPKPIKIWAQVQLVRGEVPSQVMLLSITDDSSREIEK